MGTADVENNNTDWDDINWEEYEPYEEGDNSDINYHNAAKDMTVEEIEAMFNEIEFNLQPFTQYKSNTPLPMILSGSSICLAPLCISSHALNPITPLARPLPYR